VISLQELLESREVRVAHQGELLQVHPGCALLCLTVQLPGPEKRNALSVKIARAGVQAVRELGPSQEELRDLETGFEGYFLFKAPALALKQKAVAIEDSHPLGRLMDLDVFSCPEPGAPVQAISRSALGLSERKCLLCDRPVRYCMRARTHTVQELLDSIAQIVNAWE